MLEVTLCCLLQSNRVALKGRCCRGIAENGESPVKIRRCRATVKPLEVEPECPPLSLWSHLFAQKRRPARGFFASFCSVSFLACFASFAREADFFERIRKKETIMLQATNLGYPRIGRQREL